MYVYLRAALRGTRQHGGWKGGNSPAPHRVSRPPATCSPLILFSLTVPVVFLSLSTPCSSALPASYSLFLRQSPFLSLRSLISFLHLSHSPCPFSLSSSLVPSFVTMHLVSPTATAPIRCCYYVVADDETSRCTHICVQKKRTPHSVKHKGEYLS